MLLKTKLVQKYLSSPLGYFLILNLHIITLQILATLEILSFPQLEHSNVRSRKKK